MSSSTFSFRLWKDVARLPLSTQAWHWVVAATLCGVVWACAAALESRGVAPNPALREEAIASSEILILGNSQYARVTSNQFVLPATNAAKGATDYEVQLAILKSLAPDMPKLRYLLLGFDNVPLRLSAMADREGDYTDLIRGGVAWEHLPLEGIVSRIRYGTPLRPLLTGKKVTPGQIRAWLRGGKVEAATKKLEQELGPNDVRKGFTYAPSQGAQKMSGYQYTLGRTSNLPANREAFFGILEYARSRRVQVILLRSPTTAAFRAARGKAWNGELERLRRDALARYPECGLTLWDDDARDLFDVTCFDDPNHMSPAFASQYEWELGMRMAREVIGSDSGKRDEVWVDFDSAAPFEGSESRPERSIGAGVVRTKEDGVLMVSAGGHTGYCRLDRAVTVRSIGGTTTIGRFPER